MKKMFTLLTFLVFSSFCDAQNHDVSGYTFYEAGLTPMAPYTFIFNRSGELVYLNKGLDQAFARAIRQNIKLDETDNIKSNLAKVLVLPDFTQQDFTLITTTINGECLPCDKQLALFDDILPKLAPLSFQRITIVLDPSKPK